MEDLDRAAIRIEAGYRALARYRECVVREERLDNDRKEAELALEKARSRVEGVRACLTQVRIEVRQAETDMLRISGKWSGADVEE